MEAPIEPTAQRRGNLGAVRGFARTGEARWLLAIVVLGAALRLGWALSVHSGLGEYWDMQWYFGTAKNLATGNGLTIRVVPPHGYLPGPGGMQTTLWPQGYPLTLAGVFEVFGPGLTAGKLLNVVASTLAIPFVFLLARRPFGETVALVATALFALYPANIFWTSVLYSDVVFTLPFVVATVLLVYAGTRPTRSQALATGLAVGYAAIIRPQALILLGAAVTYWLLCGVSARAVLKPLSLSVAGICVLVVPNAIWNSARTGEITALSNNFGYNLRIGHAPYSTGRYIFPTDLWASSGIDPASGALPSESLAVRRAAGYAVHHPIDEMRLSAKKVFYLYTTDSDSIIWASTFDTTRIWGSTARGEQLMVLADTTAYITLILALVAVPLTFSWRDERLLLWLILAFWTAAHIVFSESRATTYPSCRSS